MPDLNTRERFLAVMNFEPDVRTLYWEFGYWVGAVERWYREGLPRSAFSPRPGLPPGNLIMAECLPYPSTYSKVSCRDYDVNRVLGFDSGSVRIPINWRACPKFEEIILEEDETTRLVIDMDGMKMRVMKAGDSMPQFIDAPVHNRNSWEAFREERFNLDNLSDRFPGCWPEVGPTYRQRDYPLGLAMDGFFMLPRELMCVETQLMMYYRDPQLMHDIALQMQQIYLAVLEEIFSRTDLDFVTVMEDMSYKNGPLISPRMFREFIAPHYRVLTEFLKARGVKVITVDTDGDCWLLIPELLDTGVTGMYPFEVNAGMDIVEVRKAYPTLQISGGLDKMAVIKGKEAIDLELDSKLPYMLSQGGYIPFVDHLVPPDVSWDNFCHYRNRIRDCIESIERDRNLAWRS